MARIYILGDSWGYPRLANLSPQVYTPKQHTHNVLKSLGHSVENYAMGGRSIRETWRTFEHTDREGGWIVWFHTEAFRDFNGEYGDAQQAYSIPAKRDQILEREYLRARHTVKERGAKLIVIGGQAPVDPGLAHILKAEWVLPDWRSELLNTQLPYTHQLCHPYLYESSACTDTHEQRAQWVEQDLLILAAMRASPLFPDDCHPGNPCHIGLAQRIHEVINTHD